MEDLTIDRPFDNFKVAITDPPYFFGRDNIIKIVKQTPFLVHILLGGRRIGKTSTLRAIEWSLLNIDTDKLKRAFPVFISLEVEQPESLDNLRYILIVRLREAIDRWRKASGTDLREKYGQFLRQVPDSNFSADVLKLQISNHVGEQELINDDFRWAFLKTLEELQSDNFSGVCFLLDEAEFILRQDWADDAWSYFRGLKDSDTALKPFLGLLLSGYRNVKEYEQRVGSTLLNISRINWLPVLTEEETKALISCRSADEAIALSEEAVAAILEWAGGHPYLIQQAINSIFDNHRSNTSLSLSEQMGILTRQHSRDFSSWWNQDDKSDGFGATERETYQAMIQVRGGTYESLAKTADLSVISTQDALEVMAGTGVIRQLDYKNYQIGARLFETWVNQNERTRK